jgi:hypothetical protein
MYYIVDRLLLDLTRPHSYAMAAPYVLGCHSVLFGFCASIICDASLLQLLIKLTIDYVYVAFHPQNQNGPCPYSSKGPVPDLL